MRLFAFRLGPGVDLKSELSRLTARCALRAGCILSCVGSVSRARLRMPGAVGEAEIYREFTEPMEIIALNGTLCADGLHLHIGLSRAQGDCIGGHLASGCIINTTAELIIGDVPNVQFHRTIDAATGFKELTVTPRAAVTTRGP
jgi:predicted DNA-binding protein with PD1-like motif